MGLEVTEKNHLEAWFVKESDGDSRLPHHHHPKEVVSLDKLAELGVLYWHLNPHDYENDKELQRIRESRGYNYMDLLEICPEKLENYEEKLRNFFREHIHADEEIRYCLEGSGYFDVRDKDDRWIRIWIKAGDMIILPAGIYHRFTLDTGNYIKELRLGKLLGKGFHQGNLYVLDTTYGGHVFAALSHPLFLLQLGISEWHMRINSSYIFFIELMRLFLGEPVWTSYNRPQEEHPSRKEYIKSLSKKVGFTVKAH